MSTATYPPDSVSKSDPVPEDADATTRTNSTHIIEKDVEGQLDKEFALPSHTDKAAEKEHDEPYTIFPHKQRITILIMISFMALVSPLSSSVYYPALNLIAADLEVSISQINISIVTYMIFQAIAPSFMGSFSDVYGRRPAYVACYIIYLGANIGLALQTNYAALLVLRMVQSAGSSGTVALGTAVAADLCTRSERGKYMAYSMMGATLGPALGPVIGGLLTQYLGWRSIFWFLAIVSAVLLAVTLLFLPETCRAVVGNGSFPPPRWNRSLLNVLNQRRLKREGIPSQLRPQNDQPKKRPNPLTSVRIALEREAGIILLYAGFVQMGFTLSLATLTSQLAQKYGYDPVIIGLCYLPIGAGSFLSRQIAGRPLDRNFRRYLVKAGMSVDNDREQDINKLDLEKARLEINLPMLYLGVASLITYGWVMDFRTSIAGPVVVLFFLAMFLSGSNMCLGILVVDLHKDQPATAAAAINLVRMLLGAAATGFGNPLIDAIGIGWTGVVVGVFLVVCSPMLWLIHWKGFEWRRTKAEKSASKSTAT